MEGEKLILSLERPTRELGLSFTWSALCRRDIRKFIERLPPTIQLLLSRMKPIIYPPAIKYAADADKMPHAPRQTFGNMTHPSIHADSCVELSRFQGPN